MVSTDIAVDPAVAAPQADPDPSVQADPVEGQAPVEVEGQADAPVEGAVAEAAKPLSLAEIPDDDLLAQLRERRNGDGLSLEDRLRKSERDKALAELRREAGKNENVTKRVTRFLEQHGIDPSEVNRNEAGELASLYDLAHADALGNIGRAWIEATADEFSIADRTLISDALSRFTDDPTGIDDLASRMLSAVRETVRGKTLAEASLADVPEGSKLRQDLMAEAQRLADAELTAREIASKQKETPPTAPVGAPAASQTEQYRSMTAAEAARLPDAQYREWQQATA